MSRVDFRAPLGWFEVPFGRSFGSFLLPFSAMCGPKVAPKTHPMPPGVPRVPPKCSKWPRDPPKWSIWVDFGAPRASFRAPLGYPDHIFVPTRAGSPAHAASMFTQGESKGDERRTRVGREEEERWTRGGHEEDERRTRRGQ